jgi:hypothetical protein
MCASEKSQWCGELYFAGAAISISGILPQIPRREAVYFLLHSIYKFRTYLTGNTIYLRSVARNSVH